MRSRYAVLAALLLALTATPAVSGTTGKLAGRVTDEKKQPLAGVNVRLEGQPLGALSDEQGNYFIIGIPAAAYRVHASLIGYAPFKAEGVGITADFTTTLDVTLRTEALELGEIVVEAERPLLQKDATNTTRFISADDIQRLPTRGYQPAAALTSGL